MAEQLSQPVNVAASTGVDPEVRVPAAVTRAAKLAESFYQNPVADAPADVPAQVQDAPAPSTEPEHVPAREPEPPQVPPAPAEVDWQHRYNSMEGRVKKQDAVINSLLSQVQQLSEPRPHPQLQDPPKRTFITDEERKVYGDDFFDVVQRKALETVQPHIERLAAENHQLRQRLGKDEARTVYQVLDGEIANWRDINIDPEFIQWLSLPDRYTRMVKAGLLKQAFADGNAGQVLEFFRGFLEEHPEFGGQQNAAPQVAPAAPAPKRQASVQLKDLAAPGKVRPAPGGTQVPVEPAVITNKDLDRFYADVRRGRWDGRPQEKAVEEARLHAAVRDGRVRFVK